MCLHFAGQGAKGCGIKGRFGNATRRGVRTDHGGCPSREEPLPQYETAGGGGHFRERTSYSKPGKLVFQDQHLCTRRGVPPRWRSQHTPRFFLHFKVSCRHQNMPACIPQPALAMDVLYRVTVPSSAPQPEIRFRTPLTGLLDL